jgi:beta-lactamase superfamily II metal-dependent hydrolase
MEIFCQALRLGDSWLGGSFWINKTIFFPLLGVFFLAWGWRRLRPASRGPYCLATFGICLPLLLPSLKLAVLDVGQGDGIYLKLQQGESLLVDGGPPYWRKFGAPVNGALEREAIGDIDHLLLTHTDRDHEGGFPSLMLRHRVNRFLWIRREALSGKKILPVLEAAERASVPVRFLGASSAPPGLRCWLAPFLTANESSPLCHAELSGGRSIWLTGDAGFPAEDWLLRQGSLPKSDFLKVGHHGSKRSSSLPFLRATGAKTALISVGRKNHYGHPTAEAMGRMKSAGMQVRRTDLEGTLRFY